jgi:hypothetical protein
MSKHTRHLRRLEKTLYWLLSLVLLWFASIAASNGLADLRYSAAKFYFEAAAKSVDAKKKKDLLTLANSAMQKALALDSANSRYHLQSARINFDLDRLSSPDSKPDLFYEQGRINLTQGLQRSPARADLWAELAKALSEKEGPTVATLAALDKALEFGPKEQSTLIVNAAVTLYFWGELDAERQRKGWLLVLEAMKDRQLARRISKIASQTRWEKQLRRSLRDRQQ